MTDKVKKLVLLISLNRFVHHIIGQSFLQWDSNTVRKCKAALCGFAPRIMM